MAIDPGALRLGYSMISRLDTSSYVLHESGVIGLTRNDKEAYAAYRHRLIDFWMEKFPDLIKDVDLIVSEQVPAVGGGNFIAATQSELVKAVVTTCQVIAKQQGVPWREIAGSTIKKQLTGNGRATKVGVRNAVIGVFPELEPRKKELTVVADESDAIGIGLVGLGFRKGKDNG